MWGGEPAATHMDIHGWVKKEPWPHILCSDRGSIHSAASWPVCAVHSMDTAPEEWRVKPACFGHRHNAQWAWMWKNHSAWHKRCLVMTLLCPPCSQSDTVVAEEKWEPFVQSNWYTRWDWGGGPHRWWALIKISRCHMGDKPTGDRIRYTRVQYQTEGMTCSQSDWEQLAGKSSIKGRRCRLRPPILSLRDSFISGYCHEFRVNNIWADACGYSRWAWFIFGSIEMRMSRHSTCPGEYQGWVEWCFYACLSLYVKALQDHWIECNQMEVTEALSGWSLWD